VFTDLSVNRPEQTLTRGTTHCFGGRNNRGVITIRNRGGGHKRLYRLITFNRRTVERASESSGQVLRIEYDPNRTARIALIDYGDELKKRYILSPFSLKVGVIVRTGKRPVLEIGNAMPLFALPTGSSVHNVELKIGGGGKLVRSAGAYAKVICFENT
jgi:large subunit ribosomal protein L2